MSSIPEIAVVCFSNINRSMEVHYFLRAQGIPVRSFGVGRNVSVLAKEPRGVSLYSFSDITYQQIYNNMIFEDEKFYETNGLLKMMLRNKEIKPCPEQFQQCKDHFDIVITCKHRVFNKVIEVLQANYGKRVKGKTHIVNIDIIDTLEQAHIGSVFIYHLVKMLLRSNDLDKEIKHIVEEFNKEYRQTAVYHSIYATPKNDIVATI